MNPDDKIDLENKISELSVRLFKSEVRFESLLRLMFSKEVMTTDEYQTAVKVFQVFNAAIGKINTIPSIMDKVNMAVDFNKQSFIKIQGDDIGLKKIIEDAGGTSDFTARFVLSKLPCSDDFTAFMKQFFDPTKNPSPDALIPDQVIQP